MQVRRLYSPPARAGMDGLSTTSRATHSMPSSAPAPTGDQDQQPLQGRCHRRRRGRAARQDDRPIASPGGHDQATEHHDAPHHEVGVVHIPPLSRGSPCLHNFLAHLSYCMAHLRHGRSMPAQAPSRASFLHHHLTVAHALILPQEPAACHRLAGRAAILDQPPPRPTRRTRRGQSLPGFPHQGGVLRPRHRYVMIRHGRWESRKAPQAEKYVWCIFGHHRWSEPTGAVTWDCDRMAAVLLKDQRDP